MAQPQRTMIPVALGDFAVAQRMFAGLSLDLDAELRRRYGAGVTADASDVVDADPAAPQLVLSVRVRRGQGGVAEVVFRWERDRTDRVVIESRSGSRLRAALLNGFATAGAVIVGAYTFVEVSRKLIVVAVGALVGSALGVAAHFLLSPLLLTVAGAHERASARLAADLLRWVPDWTRTSRAVVESRPADAPPTAGR